MATEFDVIKLTSSSQWFVCAGDIAGWSESQEVILSRFCDVEKKVLECKGTVKQ